jgi:hypothetical protein
MENRKQIFIDGENQYTLAQQENMTMLYYSDSEIWNSTCRGQFVLGLECTGNDFKIVGGLNKKNVIDYSEAIELLILLSAVKESKIEIFEKTGEI